MLVVFVQTKVFAILATGIKLGLLCPLKLVALDFPRLGWHLKCRGMSGYHLLLCLFPELKK